MAKRTMVLVHDDMDGAEGAHTVSFGLEGKSYEIDLTPENEDNLRQRLAPYINRARKVRRNQATGRAEQRTDRSQSAAIRRWALEQGMDVPPRGRIPRHVRQAYENAYR